jgi:hypothetical protein
MNTRTILGAAIARKLLYMLATDKNVWLVEAGLSLHARRTKAGTLVVSLGAVAADHPDVDPQVLHRMGVNRAYIRTTAEVSAVNVLISGYWLKLRAMLPLLRAQRALETLCDTRVVPESWDDAAPIANTQMYDQMTQTDIDAWTPIVAALPLK